MMMMMILCDKCFESSHVRCASLSNQLFLQSKNKLNSWTCQCSIISVLPFNREQDLEHCFGDTPTSDENYLYEATATDPHFQALESPPKNLKVVHLNTQSMASTFDELVLTRDSIKEYPFDVVTMSETWLKNNSLSLQHVTIPGYSCEFRNRESVKGGGGGGIGAYIPKNQSLNTYG